MPKKQESYEAQVAKGMNPAGGPDQDVQAVAEEQGTRVWNQWDDATAAKLEEEFGAGADEPAVEGEANPLPVIEPAPVVVKTAPKRKASAKETKK